MNIKNFLARGETEKGGAKFLSRKMLINKIYSPENQGSTKYLENQIIGKRTQVNKWLVNELRGSGSFILKYLRDCKDCVHNHLFISGQGNLFDARIQYLLPLATYTRSYNDILFL